MNKSVELRTGIPALWGIKGEREVFSCVGDFKGFVEKMINQAGLDQTHITDQEYLRAFTSIDESSRNIEREQGQVIYVDAAILNYTGDIMSLVNNIHAS